MEVKITKLDNAAVIPKYASIGAAGMDLTAVSKSINSSYIEYGTGLVMAIPKGYVGLIFPRSSIVNTGLSLSNSVGVIDSDYRGEVKAKFFFDSIMYCYDVGDRVAQIIIIPFPTIQFTETPLLDKTERGTGGYGSPGK